MKKRFLLVAILAALFVSQEAFAAIAVSPPNTSVAIGNDSSAIGTGDIAIGGETNSSGDGNINIGGYIAENGNTSTLTENSTVAQSAANVGGSGSTSGTGGTSSTAINNSDNATAYGSGATVYSTGERTFPPETGTAIGDDAQTNSDVAIGTEAQSGRGTQSSEAPLDNTVINGSVNDENLPLDRFGVNDETDGETGEVPAPQDNTSIGGGTTYGNDNVAEGSGADATGDGSIAIGGDATAGKTDSISLVDPSTAVGKDATATGTDSEAYGYGSSATGNDSEALGTDSAVQDSNSVALGAHSTANTAPTGTSSVTIRGQSYSVAGSSSVGTVSVGSSGNDRLITHVAAGQISATSTNAVNGSELYATNQALNNLQATASSTGVLHYTTSSGSTSTTPTATASAGNATTGPVTISNVGNGTIAEGNTTAANGNDVWESEQAAQGYANQAQQQADLHSNDLFNLTCHQTDNGTGDIICGRGSSVQGQGAIAQGDNAEASGNGATAYGAGSRAEGNAAVAVGPDARAYGYSTTAMGDHAQALAPNSTAVGQDSEALGSGSVALGYGSIARRPNSVSVGNAASGLDRQVTNVASGTEPHDAVNLQQFEDGLKGIKGDAQAIADKVGSVDASMAGAAAEAAAGQHRNTIAGSTAEYNGQSSFAFAYQHRWGSHWAAMLSVGSNGQPKNTAVDAAGSYSWK
ncbi:YadA family autotransporter adhesin [Acidithiobacillus sulfurivorans]|uniref:Trimeric autotransporter adhesin YadA-like head domain-containing protein n=1 Tax=Acidithiobacillus sulfurivorans TaxID=1958756 RepID=A0ABS5ZZ95_9PROT|nr:hypothetical protein [Acidithiobacillus sulfurivorans]MBU2759963.1 hypothetical protein [Acidithiobacillus sulfurivorans]